VAQSNKRFTDLRLIGYQQANYTYVGLVLQYNYCR